MILDQEFLSRKTGVWMPIVGPGEPTHIGRAWIEQTELLGSNTLLAITKVTERNLVSHQPLVL